MNELTTHPLGRPYSSSDWYQAIVTEAKSIITEGVFSSRWFLIEAYWQLGKLLREDSNIREHAKGNQKFLQDLAKNIGISERTLYYTLQVFDKYPEIDTLPEGKNLTWAKLITKYLPTPEGKMPLECVHEPVVICSKCHRPLPEYGILRTSDCLNTILPIDK
jgi:hypothetical protein